LRAGSARNFVVPLVVFSVDCSEQEKVMSNTAQVQHDKITGGKARAKPNKRGSLDEALEESFPASDPPSQAVPVTTNKADGQRLNEAAKETGGAAKEWSSEAEAKRGNTEAKKQS
jgi:hypothetical protein